MSKLKERRREIAGMDLVAAQEELKAMRRQLFDLRIQKERGEVKDTRQFAKTKNDIARLLYHIGELHHEAAMTAEGLGSEEPAATAHAGAAEAEAPRAGRARRGTAVASETSAKTSTETSVPAATSARRTAARTTPASTTVTTGTTSTSVPLPEAEPLSTPELPEPTGSSEE